MGLHRLFKLTPPVVSIIIALDHLSWIKNGTTCPMATHAAHRILRMSMILIVSAISPITSTISTSTPPLTDPPNKRPVPLPPAITTSTSASTQRLKLPSAIARSALKQRPRASSVSFADQMQTDQSSEDNDSTQPTTPVQVIEDDDDDDDDEEVDFGLAEGESHSFSVYSQY